MNGQRDRPTPGWLSALKPYAQREPRMEHAICELCGAPMAVEHQHLIEPPTRRLLCCCRACALLFGGGAQQRYALIPADPPVLLDPPLSDSAWDGLAVPVGIAMIYRTTNDAAIALYPSPAGATESVLSPDAWHELVAETPQVRDLARDVQALLVNRLGTTNDAYVVPIDLGFKLVGIIRLHWRGLSGQSDVWRQIAAYFADLRSQATARTGRTATHAS